MERIAAVGTAKGLFLIDDAGLRGPLFPGERVPAVAVAPDGRMIAASVSDFFGPTIRLSDDMGETWTEHDERVIAFPEGLEWRDFFGGNEVKPAALKQVWQLKFGAEPGVVWAGTEPAALWKSEDGGKSFSMVRSLWDHPHRAEWMPGGGGEGLHTILIDPDDPARMHIAVSAAGVYRTDDGGSTWKACNSGISSPMTEGPPPEFGQCVHKVDRDAVNPDRLFLQNHGGLYRSDNRGDSWEPIANDVPSDFGFPMVTHSRQAETAYCIPLAYEGRWTPEGKCAVYRTADGGKSWAPLTNGLPQNNAFVTVLRDGFCRDDGDPMGLWFGTRSGHVFRSDDEGESWTTAAELLPDVLCVRAIVR